jgi:ribosomal protein S18 acetylase RimI-like enzyme
VADGKCVGFITCDVSADRGWIDQVGVAPDERRRGLARNLILSAMYQFRAEGLQEASLHVNINNPGAAALYHRLGFVCRLQRARYQKEA